MGMENFVPATTSEHIINPEQEFVPNKLNELLDSWGFSFDELNDSLRENEAVLENTKEGESPSQTLRRVISENYKGDGSPNEAYIKARSAIDQAVEEYLRENGFAEMEAYIISMVATATVLLEAGNLAMAGECMQMARFNAEQAGMDDISELIEDAWPQEIAELREVDLQF
jgi:hypothetical protein